MGILFTSARVSLLTRWHIRPYWNISRRMNVDWEPAAMTCNRLSAWLTLALALAGCTAAEPGCTPANTASRVMGDGKCLVIKTFEPQIAASSPVLYVVVHGDGSTPGPLGLPLQDRGGA